MKKGYLGWLTVSVSLEGTSCMCDVNVGMDLGLGLGSYSFEKPNIYKIPANGRASKPIENVDELARKIKKFSYVENVNVEHA